MCVCTKCSSGTRILETPLAKEALNAGQFVNWTGMTFADKTVRVPVGIMFAAGFKFKVIHKNISVFAKPAHVD